MSTHIINFPGADIHTTTITSVSNVSVGENLDVTSNLTVSGNTVVSQELSVSGNVEVGTANLFVDTTTGNVGVGVAHPTSAKLQVAGSLGMAKGSEFFAGDDVVMELPKHDRPLVKYPEVAMTANSSGGYVASASTTYNNNDSVYVAFNEDGGTTSWLSQGGRFDTSSPYGANSSASTFDGIQCEWLQLQLPRAVKVSYFKIIPRSTAGGTNAAPEDQTKSGSLYGSNDGSAFTKIMDYGDLDYGGASGQVTQTVTVNASVHYKYLRLTCTARYGNYNNQQWIGVGELEYYGTEEGDTSVDVVHRSIPNKPGQQHLEVYWDANDSNSYSFADSSSVYDLSGSGVTGTITGNNGFDAEYNAWVFDGSGDYISTTSSGLGTGGAFDHSFAFWFKINRNITNNDYVVTFGEETNDNMIAVNISGNTLIHFDNWGRGVITGDIVRLGTWYHVACTHTGSATGDINNQLIYVNGVRQTTSATGTGTLAFTSNKITIGARPGGGTPTAFLDGAVSNVRFFKGKALNADQVRELYEYDAPRFGHRQNLVSLHKGNLGVGVAHPTSRFEVAGTETLQEYPPRAMTGFDTYMEGHGVFRASQSIPYPLANYTAWKVFDKSLAYGAHWLDSYSSTADYIYDGAGTRSDGLGGIAGDWVMLEMPYAINLKSFAIAPASLARAPEDFVILGSNDGTLWTQLINYTGLGSSDWPYSGGQYILKHFDVPSTKHYYKYFAIVVTRTESNDYLQIDAMEYYGTPAPSGLEDGHLTLGKALTLPRVSGHPAGAETPRAESLVVHYDTTVDSVVSGSTVVDVSGNGINGTLTDGAAYSSTERALTFDGTGDYVKGAIPSSLSGNHPYTFSLWIKPDAIQSGYIAVFEMGLRTNDRTCALYLNGGAIVHAAFANNLQATTSVAVNQWMHIVGTYTSGSRKVYADGVLLASDSYSSLNIGATEMTLGANNDDSQEFNGSISNFKLYDVALTADEVAAEYALGRTGKALNITDTAVCLGGTVPRAQLDVRGSMIIDGIIKHSAWPAFRVTTNNGENVFSNGSGGTNAKSSGHNNNTNSSDEVIPWKNVVYDNTGSYTYSGAGDYKFTAPVSGIYHFHFHCLFTRSSTNSVRLDLKFFVNGGLNAHLEMHGDFSSSAAHNVGRGHTTSVHLNAGDYVQVVFTGVGGQWGVYTSGGNAYFNVFSGQLIAAD